MFKQPDVLELVHRIPGTDQSRIHSCSTERFIGRVVKSDLSHLKTGDPSAFITPEGGKPLQKES